MSARRQLTNVPIIPSTTTLINEQPLEASQETAKRKKAIFKGSKPRGAEKHRAVKRSSSVHPRMAFPSDLATTSDADASSSSNSDAEFEPYSTCWQRSDLASIAAGTVPPSPRTSPDVFSSTVQIFTSFTQPNYLVPWQSGGIHTGTGTGLVVSVLSSTSKSPQKFILTNAHVVVSSKATLRVQKQGHAAKFKARVKCIGQDCDLALLEVEDEVFWHKLCPLDLNENLPYMFSAVRVVGYPAGGKNICVTKGVVSRIDVQRYTNGGPSPLLTIQIDAAVNPGNSGGPVFDSNHRVIGVARAYGGGVANCGYIVPVPVIKRFLYEFATNGCYLGMTQLGFRYHFLESPAFRASLGMHSDESGVYCTEVAPLGVWQGKLQHGDVILEVNSHSVSNEGDVLFRKDERIGFPFLITSQPLPAPIEFCILRDGRRFRIKADPSSCKLPLSSAQFHEADCKPSYYIFGGCVFQPFTGPLYQEVLATRFRKMVISYHLKGVGEKFKEEEGDELILLTKILPSDCNEGYLIFEDRVPRLAEVNGIPVRNMRDLIGIVESGEENYVTFTIIPPSGIGENQIVLSRREVEATSEEILDRNNIPHLMSREYRDN